MLPRRSFALLLGLALLAPACTSTPAPQSAQKADDLHTQVRQAIADFRQQDPSLQRFFDNSYAYAVFPTVTSGAAGVGGAYGKGEVIRDGRMIGYADLSQANIGLQLGGQEFSQIVFFDNAAAFNSFRNGELAFDARASAIAASSGAAATADYRNGVAVFTLPQGGLMFQAAIGGQQFRFTPMDQAPSFARDE